MTEDKLLHISMNLAFFIVLTMFTVLQIWLFSLGSVGILLMIVCIAAYVKIMNNAITFNHHIKKELRKLDE